MRKRIIDFLHSCYILKWIIPFYHRILGKTRFTLDKNVFCCGRVVLYKNIFKSSGSNNRIEIEDNCHIENSRFNIKGNSNIIHIGESGFINGLEIAIQGNDNQIYIGKNIFILDDTRFYVVDGSRLTIGDSCMFSDRIDIRTTDNHSIIDCTTLERINYEKDVIIGNNVWVGTRVNILKGTILSDWCIVGAGSVVTGKQFACNTIIAGNPAVEVKNNIKWKMERI